MDIKALQTRLREFAAARDWQPYHAPKNLAMALMVEAAELLELFQWQTLTESRGFTRNAPDKERVADEIADVLLYLLQLADHTGVDLGEAVERKLRKNAVKHPAKKKPGDTAVGLAVEPVAAVPAPVPARPKVHLLVDWENVQPHGAQLKALAPHGTDVWLFRSPLQRIDAAWHAEYGDSVTQVPIARPGKNALDFHLSWYMGYISARQPDATFIVVSNDKGYDPMLEHARDLRFLATRREFHKTAPAVAAVPLKAEKIIEKMLDDMAHAQVAHVFKEKKTPEQTAPAVLPAPPAPPAVVKAALVAKLVARPRKQTSALELQAPDPGGAHAATACTAPMQAAGVPAPPVPESDKATRQQMQALVQCLQQMKPAYRPAHRLVLLAVIKAQLGEASVSSPRVVHALAQLRAQQWVVLKGDGVDYPPRPGVAQAAQAAQAAQILQTPRVAQAAPSTPKTLPARKKAVSADRTRTAPASALKLLRQKQAQQAVKLLEQMDAVDRPARRNALLGLLAQRSQATSASAHAPAVVHAMAHLLAQGWVVVQGEKVAYPRWQPQPATALQEPLANKTPAKKSPAKKATVKKAPAAAPASKKPSSAAQTGQKVLASLARMPDNRPARPPALLALIRTHTGETPENSALAHQVLSWLQARGSVVQTGHALTYHLLPDSPKTKAE